MKARTNEPQRTAYPQARRAQLIIQQLADETLIYDEAHYKALCLNSSAAFLFHHCDGKTPASVLARKLGTHFKTPASEEVVHLGLAQLSKEGLLCERLHTPRAVMVSRRTMMKRTGVAAALTLPLVTAIVAPRAVQAATQGASGAACTDGSECASGVCNVPVCQ